MKEIYLFLEKEKLKKKNLKLFTKTISSADARQFENNCVQ
jgi:hypothetical protein